jgi:hypothetical protein
MSRPLSGYPQSCGAKQQSVFPHAGPASYTQVTATAGTVPATGGDTVKAQEAGLKYFDIVLAGTTSDGAFKVEAMSVTTSTGGAGATATWKLKWISNVTATVGGQSQVAGTEAASLTDLSGESVRLFAIGL